MKKNSQLNQRIKVLRKWRASDNGSGMISYRSKQICEQLVCGAGKASTIKKQTVAIDTQAQEQLLRHRRVWEKKPVLRRVYNEEFFARLLSFRIQNGFSVEVGAGPGFLKQAAPNILSSDLVWCPWLDAVADAQQLPFRASRVSNIFGLDMLHHLAAPMRFLREAERVLRPGGRLLLIEPWITPFSYLIFRFLHQERCDLSASPSLQSQTDKMSTKLAFDGNQAIPYLLFGPRNRSNTLNSLPGFKLLALEPFCLFAYLLSGGFKPMNCLPGFAYPAISKFERATLPLWRRIAALRALVVLEKTN
ncbi:MAG: methyltransferase domain-containing protein [Candidatus Acidiferrum sp.]